MTVLEARDLAVTPPGALDPAVQGVSLSVARGEWVALTGPNGGGKTCLLLALSGLWPASGSLELFGQALDADPKSKWRMQIAVVLQDPSSQILQPTVFEEIAFTARNAGVPEPEVEVRVHQLAGCLGLSAELGRDPARMSAGRQQLVLLGGALAGNPEILYADEVTAHLDPQARRRARALVTDRVSAGLAVVWVTQVRDELDSAHRVVAIGDSRLDQAPSPPIGRRSASQPALYLHIRPARGSEGPRVAVATPADIPVQATGVTGLIGPNGVGKSVLLLAAAGLAGPPQILVEWKVAPEPPPIAALQYPEQQIFEEQVADELAFAAVSRGMERGQALELARHCLRELRMDSVSLLARRTWGLATGEKRIVEVVAALIAPACLRVLDEPTAGLDPIRRAALARLVADRAAHGPVLVASQDREWLDEVGAQVHHLGPAPGEFLTKS